MKFTRPVFFVVLAAGSFLAYSNSFNVPFLFDDAHTIVRNAGLRDLADIKAVLTSDAPLRPFLYLTFALNFAAGGLNPFGYHLVNFLLHLATSYLVFLILADLFKRDGLESDWLPAAATMLFAVHPISVEAVTYVSSRSTGMAVFFYLLAFRLVTAADFRIGARFFMAIAAFILGCLTKEIAVTLPVLLTIFAVQFYDKDRIKKMLPALALLWSVVPLLFAYRAFITGHAIEGDNPDFAVTPVTYFYTQLVVVALRYIPRLFVPINQVFDADDFYRTSPLDPQVIAGGLLLAFLLYLAAVNFRKRRAISFLILWFLVTLSVTSSFITIFDAYAERRLYIALPAFAGIVAYLAFTFTQSRSDLKRALPAFAVTVILALGSLTYARNRLFASPILLWEDTISKTRGKFRIYAGLAYEYIKGGEFERAEEILNFARMAFPNEVTIKLGHALMLGATGRFDRMETALAVIKPKKTGHRSQYNSLMGILEGQKGNYEKAMRHFNTALKLNPANTEASVNMAVLLTILDRKEEAIKRIRETIAKYPYKADLHYQLANMIADTNRAEALKEYHRTLEMDPFHLDAKAALGMH